ACARCRRPPPVALSRAPHQAGYTWVTAPQSGDHPVVAAATGSGGDGAAPRVNTVRWSADWYAPSSAGWCGDPPRLPTDGWQKRDEVNGAHRAWQCRPALWLAGK